MVHHRVRHPYLLAEEEGCLETFSSAGHARQHLKTHLRISHPFPCLRKACDQRFLSLEEAMIHSKHPDHSPVTVYLYPVTTCVSAVAGRTYTKPHLIQHFKSHRSGQLGNDIDLIPQPVVSVPICSELSLWSLIQLRNCSGPSGKTPGTGLSQGLLHDYEGEEQEISDPATMDDEGPGLTSGGDTEEHSILATERYSHPHVSLSSLGRTCVRPSSQCEGMVAERCSQENLIDLDSAHLQRNRDDLILSSRCIACDFYRTTTRFLTSIGMELQEENLNCPIPGCNQTSFHKSGRCTQHLQRL
ncbi:hypothetical protein B0J13DRAFT_551457, partial [Dactylonectria estremocensis]